MKIHQLLIYVPTNVQYFTFGSLQIIMEIINLCNSYKLNTHFRFCRKSLQSNMPQKIVWFPKNRKVKRTLGFQSKLINLHQSSCQPRFHMGLRRYEIERCWNMTRISTVFTSSICRMHASNNHHKQQNIWFMRPLHKTSLKLSIFH